MAEIIQVGQEAPDFTLRDEQNQEVTLSKLRGQPVVLVFYPLDFSPVCESEMCTIRDDWSEFVAAGARVLAISRDSVWTHKAWKEQRGLKHTLLADMKGDVARAYGAWNEQLGLAERLAVVIDGGGRARYLVRSELRTPRDFNAVLEAVRAAAQA